MGHRALRLMKLGRVELDETRPDRPGVIPRWRHVRGERLLEQPGDVTMSVRPEIPVFERRSRARIGGVETQELLMNVDGLLFVPGGPVDQARGLSKELDLLGAGAVRSGRDVHVGEPLHVARLPEQRAESLERCRVAWDGCQYPFEVIPGAQRIAEHIGQVRRGSQQHLGDDRRREHLDAAALRVGLERERELAHAIVTDGCLVQLRPRLGGELAPPQRCHERVEQLFFTLQLRVETRPREIRDRARATRRFALHQALPANGRVRATSEARPWQSEGISARHAKYRVQGIR